jgi:hypothetical protein
VVLHRNSASPKSVSVSGFSANQRAPKRSFGENRLQHIPSVPSLAQPCQTLPSRETPWQLSMLIYHPHINRSYAQFKASWNTPFAAYSWRRDASVCLSWPQRYRVTRITFKVLARKLNCTAWRELPYHCSSEYVHHVWDEGISWRKHGKFLSATISVKKGSYRVVEWLPLPSDTAAFSTPLRPMLCPPQHWVIQHPHKHHTGAFFGVWESVGWLSLAIGALRCGNLRLVAEAELGVRFEAE